jgi:hypothetical protein
MKLIRATRVGAPKYFGGSVGLQAHEKGRLQRRL